MDSLWKMTKYLTFIFGLYLSYTGHNFDWNLGNFEHGQSLIDY